MWRNEINIGMKIETLKIILNSNNNNIKSKLIRGYGQFIMSP